MKKERGITLIALVITIIIMLILAGVAISAVFGENGLIKRTKDTVKQTEISSEKEYLEIETLAYLVEFTALEDGQDFTSRLATGWSYLEEDQKYIVVVSPNINQFRVNKITGVALYIPEGASLYKLAGSGIKNDPYLVQTINDLDTIARSIDGILEEETGQDFGVEGVYIELARDLDFDNENDYYYPEDKAIIKARFKGIGYKMEDFNKMTEISEIVMSSDSKEQKETAIKEKLDDFDLFWGIFNGNGYSISNYESENALFGVLAVGSRIENMTINVNIDTSYWGIVGGIAQVLLYGEIENCKVTGSISSNSINTPWGGSVVGGFVGWSSEGVFNNCCNSATVSGTWTVGGFGGSIHGCILSNCYNTGKIIGIQYSVGGIAGSIGYTVIRSCYTTGQVNGSSHCGGFVGAFDDYDNEIVNCFYLFGTERDVEYDALLNISITQLTEDEMKDLDFVSTLGTNKWKMDSSKNNGFPILHWE